jgi:hypothetical protein
MGGQQENLDRVSQRIAPAVLAFCQSIGLKEFFADDLRRYVRRMVGEVAPGSPDRVLRDLRRKGMIDYRVVSRSESLYQMLRVGPRPAAPANLAAAEQEALF